VIQINHPQRVSSKGSQGNAAIARLRHSGAMRKHRTRNLEIPGLVLRTIPE